MKAKDIKAMKAEGNSDFEILASVVDSGVEFPDGMKRPTSSVTAMRSSLCATSMAT